MSADETLADTRVVLPVVNLGDRVRLPDRPGDMEIAIARALTEAASRLSVLGRNQRVVLLGDSVRVAIHVEVMVEGVQVPDEIDIEEVRRSVRHLPRDPYRDGLFWDVGRED